MQNVTNKLVTHFVNIIQHLRAGAYCVAFSTKDHSQPLGAHL